MMKKRIFPLLLALVLLSVPAIAGSLKTENLSYEPAPVSPGSAMTVWIQVKNDSVYASEDAIVKLDLEFPFSLQPGEEEQKSLGGMSAFETRTVEFKVLVDTKALNGASTVKVLAGEGFPTRTDSFAISILSRTPKLEIVKSDTELLAPGAAQPVTLTIKNVGGGIAKDIVIKVNPDRTVTSTGVVVEREIVSLGAAANYLDHLNVDEEKNVTLTLAVNQSAERKNYSIPITIEYFDQNGTSKTGTAYLGIKVSADAQVDAVINSVTPKAYPGGTSEIVVDLFNVGLADARYAVIDIQGSGLSFEEPRQFIGTLEADDFDSFKTNMTVAPETPLGETAVVLKITYKDEQLNEIVETKTLAMKVVSAGEAIEGAGDPVLGLLNIAIILLALIGLYVVAKWAWPRAKAFIGKRKK